MKRIILLNLLSLLISIVSFSQQDESWKLFDDTQVGRVDITIDTAKLNWIYNNVQSDSEHYAVFRFKNKWVDETVDSVGFRLRGNTSRISKKKSFKVSFNTFNQNKEFYGIDAMNLNGEHNDPSIIRSKICFEHFKSIGLPASRSTHIQVYINNQYYGLYIFVEQIDKEFLEKNFQDHSGNLWKCLYPADLAYLGSNPLTYINLKSSGRKVYELKTNEAQNDFTKFVRFISILNNIPINQLADSIESVLDVSGVLKYFAMNILTGSWDDYWSLMNNYYLYHQPSKDIFHIIPYDYDNTFGIDFSGKNWTTANPYSFPKVVNGARPLAERLLSVPQYRNLYTHFLEFYREKVFLLSNWENKIDNIQQMIVPYVLADTFRNKDYGFTPNDFFNSYLATGYSNQHVKYGLKQFINLRNSSLISQLNYQTSIPIIYKIDFEPKNPMPTDTIKVIASAFSKTGLSEISIHFLKSSSTTPQIIPMHYAPINSSKQVEDADRYIGIIPPIGNDSGKFSIFVKDILNQSQFYPRLNSIKVKTNTISILINEFLADNINTNRDPNGEYDDWIELYNSSSSKIILTGKYLTDNLMQLNKWRFTRDSLFINPNEFLLVWCDEQQSQPGIHTNFKLSKTGEFIALVDTNGTTILDSITFSQQQSDISLGRFPDASSTWKFLTPTPANSNIYTNIKDENSLEVFVLYQNYPNPFNPTTSIRYSVMSKGNVSLKVFDILGSEVVTLVDEVKNTGEYEIEFNSKLMNENQTLNSSIYFYQLKINSAESSTHNYIQTKKMILLK